MLLLARGYSSPSPRVPRRQLTTCFRPPPIGCCKMTGRRQVFTYHCAFDAGRRAAVRRHEASPQLRSSRRRLHFRWASRHDTAALLATFAHAATDDDAFAAMASFHGFGAASISADYWPASRGRFLASFSAASSLVYFIGRNTGRRASRRKCAPLDDSTMSSGALCCRLFLDAR